MSESDGIVLERFCKRVIDHNQSVIENFNKFWQIYASIRRLLVPICSSPILRGDLVLASINRNIDVHKINILLKGDELPSKITSIADWIICVLVSDNKLVKEADRTGSKSFRVDLTSGEYVFLAFEEITAMKAHTQFDTLILNHAGLRICTKFLPQYKALCSNRHIVNDCVMNEDMLTQNLSDAHEFKCRSIYEFSSNKEPLLADASELLEDWNAAASFTNLLFLRESKFSAWQGSFPFFVRWNTIKSDGPQVTDRVCCICLTGGCPGILQSCGHAMHAWCGYKYHAIGIGISDAAKPCPLCRRVVYIKTMKVCPETATHN